MIRISMSAGPAFTTRLVGSLLATGLVLAALPALAAPSGSPRIAQEPPTSVTATPGVKKKLPPDNIVRFWHALPPKYAGVLEEQVQQYRQSHPKLDIRVRSFDTPQALREALRSSTEQPHLALIDTSWQRELIERHQLVMAEAQMDRISPMERIVLKADSFPVMFQAVQQDGHIWSLPAFAVGEALLYDTEKITASKVKVGAGPRTWDQVVALAGRLTDAKTLCWGLSLPLDRPIEFARLFHTERQQWTGRPAVPPPALVGASTTTKVSSKTPHAKPKLKTKASSKPAAMEVAPSGVAGLPPAMVGTQVPADQPDLALAAPEYKAVLGFWRDATAKYKVVLTTPEKRDQAAMLVGTVEDLLACQASGRKMDAWPLPTFYAPANPLTVYSMAVLDIDTKHVERNWHLAEWMVDFERQLEWSTRTPYLPSNQQVTKNPTFNQYAKEHPGLRAFVNQLPTGLVAPSDPAFEASLEHAGQILREGVLGEKALSDILTEAAAKH